MNRYFNSINEIGYYKYFRCHNIFRFTYVLPVIKLGESLPPSYLYFTDSTFSLKVNENI